jgi:RND family efflux transporter MFP subunit
MLVLLAAVLWFGCQGSGAGDQEETQVPVEVEDISLGAVYQTLSYNGDIKAELEVRVFSKVPDRIEAYYVDEGDGVAKGTPIAKIVATTIEQAVRQAEAGLVAAEAQEANLRSEYARAQRLHDEDAMSLQEYDAIKTQYDAAVAQLEQAKAALATAMSQLDDATITSPIRGIVGARHYEAGDMASPAIPVVTVVQMERVEIQVEATESDLGRLSVGQKAEVRVKSYPDEIFVGSVTRISPILDPMTRMATVEVLIPNSDGRLKPGMYAEVEITTGVLEDTIVVPRYVVVENTSLESTNGEDRVVKNYFVYVINDSARAEQRELEVDYVNHQQIAVRSGIRVGERLVVAGQNNLRDGLPVLIVGEGAE